MLPTLNDKIMVSHPLIEDDVQEFEEKRERVLAKPMVLWGLQILIWFLILLLIIACCTGKPGFIVGVLFVFFLVWFLYILCFCGSWDKYFSKNGISDLKTVFEKELMLRPIIEWKSGEMYFTDNLWSSPIMLSDINPNEKERIESVLKNQLPENAKYKNGDFYPFKKVVPEYNHYKEYFYHYHRNVTGLIRIYTDKPILKLRVNREANWADAVSYVNYLKSKKKYWIDERFKMFGMYFNEEITFSKDHIDRFKDMNMQGQNSNKNVDEYLIQLGEVPFLYSKTAANILSVLTFALPYRRYLDDRVHSEAITFKSVISNTVDLSNNEELKNLGFDGLDPMLDFRGQKIEFHKDNYCFTEDKFDDFGGIPTEEQIKIAKKYQNNVVPLYETQERDVGFSKYILNDFGTMQSSNDPPKGMKQFNVGVFNIIEKGSVSIETNTPLVDYSKTHDSDDEEDEKNSTNLVDIVEKYMYNIKRIIANNVTKIIN